MEFYCIREIEANVEFISLIAIWMRLQSDTTFYYLQISRNILLFIL